MSKTKILLVDDRPENILALSELIAAGDIEVLSATSAESALELLVKYDFALALLDVQMPQINGFELARLIRGVKRFKDLPIIFVTAHQQDRSFIFEGYESGAVDLLFKPLDPHVVRSKVRVFVKIDQQTKMLHSQMKQLQELRTEAEQANLAKSRFLANMSHEIRTPLSAVLGFAEILNQESVPEKERKTCLDGLKRNGQLLKRLVDDILDFSKIEAQHLDLENIRFNLAELIKDVSTTVALKAQEKGLKFTVEEKSSLNMNFNGDPTRIKQVLLNIIGNSIKFTAEGRVLLNVECSAADRSGYEWVKFTVQDEGIGVNPEEAERLFQPFTQADSSTTRQFGGTGLGLAISRQFAQHMGGDIRLVESTLGQGSTFEITMLLGLSDEIDSAQESAPVKITTPKFDGRKLLIVDDSPDNRIFLEMCLRNSGITIQLAENGLQAIQAVENGDPDLILMDVQMPGMDGHEATRRIRQLGFQKPIFALTAHGLKEEHDRCKKAGCDRVLTKPITRDKLLTNLSDVFLRP